jgi:hypothetical protein
LAETGWYDYILLGKILVTLVTLFAENAIQKRVFKDKALSRFLARLILIPA